MPDTVKVLLASNEPSLEIECRGAATWYAVDGSSHELEAGAGTWTVTRSGDDLLLNDRPTGASRVILQPARAVFRLDGRNYRGRLMVRIGDKTGITALNELSTEYYLRSVVGAEMYASWPLDALMAQAVAARTYLLFAVGRKGYLNRVDMAYRGIESENRGPNLAVEVTRNIILVYHDRVLPAYFHSTCGGHTASVKKVFDEPFLAPLLGVECGWCTESSTYEWEADVSAAHLAEALAEEGVDEVRSVVPEDTEPDGYARTVLLNGSVRMNANRFRFAAGAGLLKSTRFKVQRQGGVFHFEGRGYGHGVGLCQWGAHGLAQGGRNWQQILVHYYPGAEIRRTD